MVSTRARELRKNQTPAERDLWQSLRRLKIHGLHFRRQAAFGYYVVDFVCHRSKIIVELDGTSHIGEPAKQYDAERTAFLNSRGYRVLRFWNSDVFENCGGVVEHIVTFAKQPPTPDPSPRWGRGNHAAISGAKRK